VQVTFFQRRPQGGQISIERVFDEVREALPAEVEAEVVRSRFRSSGIMKRLYNIVEAGFRQGEINHITGDVHFLALLLPKKTTLLTIHDCFNLERLSGVRRWIVWFFWFYLPIRRAGWVSVISESTRQQLLASVRCDPAKIHVVHDPCPTAFRPSPKPFCQEEPVVLQIGTQLNKNLLRVAEALRGVRCRLRIIGNLSESQRETLDQCGIAYSTDARISDAQLIDEYRRADLVVFASTYEGFGLPILEAQATGRPVVTSNILSMREVAGGAACLVDPLEVADIRRGILRVIEDKSYREQLVARGYENVTRFRPEAIAADYVRLYRMMLGLEPAAEPFRKAA